MYSISFPWKKNSSLNYIFHFLPCVSNDTYVFNKQTKFMSYCCLKSYEDLVIEWHPGWQRCIVWGIRHVKWWCGCVHKMLIFFVTRWYTWSNLKRWLNCFYIHYIFKSMILLRIKRKYNVLDDCIIVFLNYWALKVHNIPDIVQLTFHFFSCTLCT